MYTPWSLYNLVRPKTTTEPPDLNVFVYDAGCHLLISFQWPGSPQNRFSLGLTLWWRHAVFSYKIVLLFFISTALHTYTITIINRIKDDVPIRIFCSAESNNLDVRKSALSVVETLYLQLRSMAVCIIEDDIFILLFLILIRWFQSWVVRSAKSCRRFILGQM
jgi:hypothetical protein